MTLNNTFKILIDMKLLNAILSVIICAVILTGCSKSVSGKPKQDADNMVKELVEAAKDKNYDEINDIVGKYYDYYSKADLVDRVSFMKSINFENLSEKDMILWHEVVHNEKFHKCPNIMRFDLLESETEKEAREKGIW